MQSKSGKIGELFSGQASFDIGKIFNLILGDAMEALDQLHQTLSQFPIERTEQEQPNERVYLVGRVSEGVFQSALQPLRAQLEHLTLIRVLDADFKTT